MSEVVVHSTDHGLAWERDGEIHELPLTPFTKLLATELSDDQEMFADLAGLYQKLPTALDHLGTVASSMEADDEGLLTRESLVNMIVYAWWEVRFRGSLDVSDHEYVNEENRTDTLFVRDRLEEVYTGEYIFNGITGERSLISREDARILSKLTERELFLLERISYAIRNQELGDTVSAEVLLLKRINEIEYLHAEGWEQAHPIIHIGRGIILQMKPMMRTVIAHGRINQLLSNDRAEFDIDALYALSKMNPRNKHYPQAEFTKYNREHLEASRDLLAAFGRTAEALTVGSNRNPEGVIMVTLRKSLRLYGEAYQRLEQLRHRSLGTLLDRRDFDRDQFEKISGINNDLVERSARLLTNLILFYHGRRFVQDETFDNVDPELIKAYLGVVDQGRYVHDMVEAFHFLPKNGSLEAIVNSVVQAIDPDLRYQSSLHTPVERELIALSRIDSRIFNLLTDPLGQPHQHLLRFMYSMLALYRTARTDVLNAINDHAHTPSIPQYGVGEDVELDLPDDGDVADELDESDGDAEKLREPRLSHRFPDVVMLPTQIDDTNAMDFWEEVAARGLPYAITEIKTRVPLTSQKMSPSSKPRIKETKQVQNYLDALSDLLDRRELDNLPTPRAYLVVITPGETKVIEWKVMRNQGNQINEKLGRWVIDRRKYRVVARY